MRRKKKVGEKGERASLDCTHSVITEIGSHLSVVLYYVTTETNLHLHLHSPDSFLSSNTSYYGELVESEKWSSEPAIKPNSKSNQTPYFNPHVQV